MPFKLLGVTGLVDLPLPPNFLAYLLLLVYGAVLALIIYRCRLDYRWLSARQWGWIAGLSLLSLLASLPLPVEPQPKWLITLTPFAAAPFLFAGAVINPAAAVVVGLFAGIGSIVGRDASVFALFHFAFAAAVAATLIRQNFIGLVYDWLRHPVVSGFLAMMCVFVIDILSTFVSATGGTFAINALDQALFSSASEFWALLLEGLLAGGLVSVVLRQWPELRSQSTPVPTPWQRSLRRRLLSQFVFFATLLAVSLLGTVFVISLNVSTKLVVNQMAHNAQTVSAQIPDFQAHLQRLLSQFDQVEDLLASNLDTNEKALGQLHRIDPFYRRIVLVNGDRVVAASYPTSDQLQASLNNREREAVAEAFQTRSPKVATAEANAEDHILSLVVPVTDESGSTAAVLIGQVPRLSLENLIVGLQGTVGEGTGFIVDDRSTIIADADGNQLLSHWNPPEQDLTPIKVDPVFPGVAYRTHQNGAAGRELIYVQEMADSSWQVVTVVPNSVVLNLALSIGGPLAAVLFVAMTFFYSKLTSMGKDITEPITGLVDAARNIAAGGKWAPPASSQRNDEIGMLSQAFGEMHYSNTRRVQELSLLLDVSHNVATNIDITQGMPEILRGALRGTGAAGARAVVVNPSGNYPRTFGEGPAADGMALLDRPLMDNMRNAKDLALGTPIQISTTLGVDPELVPVPALFAIRLQFHGHFRGVLWLGYRQAHGFDPASRTLLRTLAGQAAVLVENARLYAVAEGGRRRLAAVLASTTDAVVVTDQTDRLLLINRAMERAFGLKASEVIGRPVADVIPSHELVEALTGSNERVPNLEVTDSTGKIHYCNVSPIINNEQQAIGRVAVLHDITPLKDIDHLKSDFVSAVSHDLLSPLTFMLGYANMLSMVGELNEQQEDYIEKILKGIEQVKSLVDDLLDLGRIEAGVQIESDEIDLKLLLSEILAQYRHQARAIGIRLQLGVNPEVPYIRGDVKLIRRAIVNLLTNGFKYAPHSGPMMMRAEIAANEVIISVRDHGPGITQEDQMRLFEKFFRGQRHDENVKGAGMGLAIVKSIAERHGGRAWCESELGKGSTFCFSVPVKDSGL